MSMMLITLASAATSCFDEKKIIPITKELRAAFQQDFCVNEIKPAHLEWIYKTALPQIINKSFLGVEPPPNWQMLSEEVVRDCFKAGNLCERETQQQFGICLQVKLPIILMQLGPWFTENCSKINDEVIGHWPEKKGQVLDLLKQFEVQSKT
ncbi:hypothetical protein Lbru_2083 [Legionella brunensis]|uniref:Uncharacterized protein n=2 Tax=Legionella brunensis TaxID=29422 RepID=A0A0W0SEF5_9GAMM|nr:hypothetical protein Lbru_2083 [Legionella brunensis]